MRGAAWGSGDRTEARAPEGVLPNPVGMVGLMADGMPTDRLNGDDSQQ